jgi:hypothetical protein
MLTRERAAALQPPTDEQLASNVGELLIARTITTRLNAGNQRKIIEEEIPGIIRSGGGVPFPSLSITVAHTRETAALASREGMDLEALNQELEGRTSDLEAISDGIILGIKPIVMRDGRGTLLAASFPEAMEDFFKYQRAQLLMRRPRIPRYGRREQDSLFGVCSREENAKSIVEGVKRPTEGTIYLPVGVNVSAPEVFYMPPKRNQDF